MCIFPLPREYPQWSKVLSLPLNEVAAPQRGYGPAVIVILSERAQEHLRIERLKEASCPR